MSERPRMTPGNVIAAAITIYRERWRDLLKATVVCVIPIVVFGLLVIATVAPEGVLEALGGTVSPEQSRAAYDALTADQKVTFLVMTMLSAGVSGLAQTLAFGACLVIVLDHRAGQTRPYADAVRRALRKLPALLWVTVLTLILTVLGLIALVVPGIWVFVAWSLAPVALFAEDRRGRAAGLRSVEVVKGSWWLVLFVGALVIGAFLILELVVGALFGAILSPLTRDNAFGSFFASGLVSSTVWLIANGIHAAVVTVLFFDLRARKNAAIQPSSATT